MFPMDCVASKSDSIDSRNAFICAAICAFFASDMACAFPLGISAEGSLIAPLCMRVCESHADGCAHLWTRGETEDILTQTREHNQARASGVRV